MDNQLPTEFDLIIVGTGMVESILSAAASRVGKRVLHIDRNDYYGGQWASFNLDAIQRQNIQDKKSYLLENATEILQDNERITSFGNDLFCLKDISFKWHISRPDVNKNDNCLESSCFELSEKNVNVEIWTKEKLLNNSRKFNIDLTPKLHYARGDFVDLLISSNVARYTEYRNVSRVLTWLNGQLEVVPCSRSDIFANSKVSVIEKRILMKLLTSLSNGGEESESYKNKTFHTFLKERNLTPNLIHYVLYAISMSIDCTPCIEGIKNTKRFLNSLGRFGKTPFLFSMYGSGEITQAFCRREDKPGTGARVCSCHFKDGKRENGPEIFKHNVQKLFQPHHLSLERKKRRRMGLKSLRMSAVFGGVYALSQPLEGYIVDGKGFKSLLVGQQRITADHIAMGIDKAPKEFVQNVTKKYISRAVLITNKSVLGSEMEHLTLILYPPESGKHPVSLIELGSLTGTCPKNVFLVHLIARQSTTPEDDFEHVITNLFVTDTSKESNVNKPQLLCSFYFSIVDTNEQDLNQGTPENVYICPGPGLDLDYDVAIKEAKKIYTELYPDMEFLPRAPDPDEIIIEGEGEVNEIVPNDQEQRKEDSMIRQLTQDLQNQSIVEIKDNENT